MPDDADLVVIGNPTNPTGVRHPADAIRALARPGRLVVVDEAFLDDDVETLAGERHAGIVVLRSLTKLWSIPGIRAGYLLAEPDVVDALRDAPDALVGLRAGHRRAASRPAATRPRRGDGASARARPAAPTPAGRTATSSASRPCRAPRRTSWPAPGVGSREALRDAGFAVRRADTFPGLSDEWVRISARREAVTDDLLGALRSTHPVLRKPVGIRRSGATVTSLSHTER